jgi:hypothetical protein
MPLSFCRRFVLGGALFFENTKGCTVRHCAFERIDGNAIFLSGYNRNTTVADNEFAWIGHSCAVGWGYTNEMDGTDGLQPRFTYLLRNYAREIGLVSDLRSRIHSARSDLLSPSFSFFRNGRA